MAMESKMVKAKLYNLRSFVEAKILEIDYGLCTPAKAFECIVLMASKSQDEALRAEVEDVVQFPSQVPPV